ncbi:MAG: hypothetical protein NT150_12565 [Bacteroidetes bacterium]|nr:hypothetical protein [Bacteroidota bacterium]
MNIFRKLVFVGCFISFGSNLCAQEKYSPFHYTFFQEGGASIYYSGYALGPSLSYWFRFNFYEFSEFLSLSASCPVSIGGYFSSYSGGYFALDLPATLDFNFGNRANDETEFPVGGFAGVGAAFNAMYGIGASRSYGPLVHTGFRTSVAGRSMTLRFSYLFGLGGMDASTQVDGNPNVIGLGLFYLM